MPENGESTKFTFHARSPDSIVMALTKVGMDLVGPLSAA
jgi:hypothetical protein